MKPLGTSKSDLAVPFITYNQKGGFALNPEAEQFIREIPENKKIGVISIVGKYRTGKSFFVNRVLLNTKKSGFQVGPTINPCTKGLWIWKKTLPGLNSDHESMETILIDTEGFGGMDENTNHDSRIFLFSLLLSSYFIYNSVGSIDQNAINTLNLIINLAKDIESKTGGKGEQVPSNFPSFLWIVRDFTLQLVDKTGNKVNSKEYLENALELQKGLSDSIENKNKIRRAFKHFFQDRDCMTMVRPTQREKDLQRLDEIDNSELRPEFLTQIENVRKKIFTKVKPKSINNKPLNGSMFIQLIKGYLQAINKGALPNIQTAWVYICRNEGMKASNLALKNLENKIEQILSRELIDESQIEQLKNTLRQEALKEFKSKSMGAQQSYPEIGQTFNKRMNNLYNQLTERNKRNWVNKYKESSEKGIEAIKDKLFRDQYTDYNQFLTDFNKLKQQYESQTGSSSEKWAYFNQISQSIHKIAADTITTKINNTLQVEKQILEEKMTKKEEQIIQKKRQLDLDKQKFRNRIEELEKNQAVIANAETTAQQRMKEIKEEKEKLQQKLSKIQLSYQQKCFQLEKLANDTSKHTNMELEEAKSEIKILKSNLDKEKALNEMQKTYHEKEIANFKQKFTYLETELKRHKNMQNQIAEEVQNYRELLKEKQQRQVEIEDQKEVLKRKVDNLISQNQKKNELMKDYNEWIVEKSYLQNQIAFLRNTVNQNKRLHDALVVALQQAVNSNESDKVNQLVETNSNLVTTLQKMQTRAKNLQQKEQKLKKYKTIVKASKKIQCKYCQKWINTPDFGSHITSCSKLEDKGDKNTKQNASIMFTDTNSLILTINQTVIKHQENKPYTEYLIQASVNNRRWGVSRKYKDFCELHQNLLNNFPSLKFPESSNAVVNVYSDINQVINTKKNMAVEEKRKSLQQFLRDLSKIDKIRNSQIFRDFLKIDEELKEEQEIQIGDKVDFNKKQLLYKALYNTKHKNK